MIRLPSPKAAAAVQVAMESEVYDNIRRVEADLLMLDNEVQRATRS